MPIDFILSMATRNFRTILNDLLENKQVFSMALGASASGRDLSRPIVNSHHKRQLYAARLSRSLLAKALRKQVAPLYYGRAFGVLVLSFAGHCSESAGKAISFPVIRSTEIA